MCHNRHAVNDTTIRNIGPKYMFSLTLHQLHGWQIVFLFAANIDQDVFGVPCQTGQASATGKWQMANAQESDETDDEIPSDSFNTLWTR